MESLKKSLASLRKRYTVLCITQWRIQTFRKVSGVARGGFQGFQNLPLAMKQAIISIKQEKKFRKASHAISRVTMLLF